MAEKTLVDSSRYIVLQWNDYRKENFLCFVGGFSSFERASAVQIKCLEEFQEKGWIRGAVVKHRYPIREWTFDPSTTNLVSRKFIQCGYVDEPEMFTVDIIEVKPNAWNNSSIEETYIETFWGGCGLCHVSVGDKISDEYVHSTYLFNEPLPERLEPVLIDLSDPSKVYSEEDRGNRNQRCDYEKRCIHCYHVKYLPDTEYPIFYW